MGYLISAIRLGDEASWPNSVYDFESYDDSIFKLSAAAQLTSRRRAKQFKRNRNVTDAADFSKMFFRQNSEPEIHVTASSVMISSNSSVVTSSSMLLQSSQPSSAITIPSSVRVKKTDNIYSSSFGALNIERELMLT